MRGSSIVVIVVALAACGSPPASPDAAVVDSGPPLGAVGAPCTTDGECRSGLTCFLGAPGAPRAWPGGYCSRDCSVDDHQCPSGSTCGEAYYAADGMQHYQCLATCDREDGSLGGCREGYFCMYDGACHVGCTSDAQCETLDYDADGVLSRPGSTCELDSGRCRRGTGTGDVNDACDTDADCRGPFGVCNGGHCLRLECDLGGEYACSAGQECIGHATNPFQLRFTCAPTCALGTEGIPGNPGPCLDTNACVPPRSDYADRATEPFCGEAPNGGSTGNPTATIGSPCTTNDDCPNPLGYGFCSGGTCTAAPCNAPELTALDVCGAGARCVMLDGDPTTDTAIATRDFSLGFCFRDCSTDSTVCEAPTTCNTDGYCAAL